MYTNPCTKLVHTYEITLKIEFVFSLLHNTLAMVLNFNFGLSSNVHSLWLLATVLECFYSNSIESQTQWDGGVTWTTYRKLYPHNQWAWTASEYFTCLCICMHTQNTHWRNANGRANEMRLLNGYCLLLLLLLLLCGQKSILWNQWMHNNSAWHSFKR